MDKAAHIIVAAELGNTALDANWLLPMIQAVSDNLGELPELGLADAGYRSEDGLKNAQIEPLAHCCAEDVLKARVRVTAIEEATSPGIHSPNFHPLPGTVDFNTGLAGPTI